MYKWYHDGLPSLFQFTPVNNIHDHSTRQSSHLYCPKLKTSLGKSKFSYQAPHLWNQILKAKINPETSEAVFCKSMKQCIKVGLIWICMLCYGHIEIGEIVTCESVLHLLMPSWRHKLQTAPQQVEHWQLKRCCTCWCRVGDDRCRHGISRWNIGSWSGVVPADAGSVTIATDRASAGGTLAGVLHLTCIWYLMYTSQQDLC